MLSEADLRNIAPAGARWSYAYDDGEYESLGVYPDWRDPRDWDASVTPYPVLHFNRMRDGEVVDWFTQDAAALVEDGSPWKRLPDPPSDTEPA